MRLKKEGLLLNSSKLIKDWELAIEPGTIGKNWAYVQDYHTSLAWLEIRNQIREEGLEDNPSVMELDKRLIENVLKYGAEGNIEQSKHPLVEWWWHLDKIARKEYPPELLPDYLREIYAK
jgi:hypothetical protein